MLNMRQRGINHRQERALSRKTSKAMLIPHLMQIRTPGADEFKY